MFRFSDFLVQNHSLYYFWTFTTLLRKWWFLVTDRHLFVTDGWFQLIESDDFSWQTDNFSSLTRRSKWLEVIIFRHCRGVPTDPLDDKIIRNKTLTDFTLPSWNVLRPWKYPETAVLGQFLLTKVLWNYTKLFNICKDNILSKRGCEFQSFKVRLFLFPLWENSRLKQTRLCKWREMGKKSQLQSWNVSWIASKLQTWLLINIFIGQKNAQP